MNIKISYPKQELLVIQERSNKLFEKSILNIKIINGLRINRFPGRNSSTISSFRTPRIHSAPPIRSYNKLSNNSSISVCNPKRGITQEEVDRMLIQKKSVIYYTRIKSTS
jgi:hypothetical protein